MITIKKLMKNAWEVSAKLPSLPGNLKFIPDDASWGPNNSGSIKTTGTVRISGKDMRAERIVDINNNSKMTIYFKTA